MAKQIVDFTGSPDDSNNRDESSILPIQDGENVAAEVFNRPHQVLRARTETLRSEVEDLKYLMDADRALLLACDGNLSVDATAESFTIPTAKTLVVRPFVGPGATSAKATVTVPTTSGSGNYLLVSATNALRAYGRTNTPNSASANDFSLEVIVGAAFNVTVSGVPARRVTITVVSGETTGDLEARLNNNTVFTAAGLVASAVGTNLEAKVTAMARTAFSGGLDAEKHSITSGGLAGFFAVAENKLADGDTLAIAYDALVNTTGGGRRQSIEGTPETKANVDANLVNLRVYPAKAAQAIPICTRVGSALVFIDGTRIAAGKGGALGGSGLEQNGGSIAGSLTLSQNLTVGGTAAFTGAVTGSTITTTDAGTFGSVVVNPTTTSTVGLTVNSTAAHSVDLSRWYSGTAMVASVHRTGSVHSYRFDTLSGAGTQLELGTVDADTIVVARDGVRTSFNGDVYFGQSALFAGADGVSAPYNIKSVAAGPTNIPLLLWGAAGQSADLQQWGGPTSVLAKVTPDGVFHAPGFDTVTGASRTLAIGSVEADNIVFGRAGITTTVESDLVINGSTTVNDDVTIVGPANTVVPLTVKGAGTSQTANLQEWMKSATAVATLDVNGQFRASSYNALTDGAALSIGATAGSIAIGASHSGSSITLGNSGNYESPITLRGIVEALTNGPLVVKKYNPANDTQDIQQWYVNTTSPVWKGSIDELGVARFAGGVGAPWFEPLTAGNTIGVGRSSGGVSVGADGTNTNLHGSVYIGGHVDTRNVGETLNIGTVNPAAINIGKSDAPTTIPGLVVPRVTLYYGKAAEGDNNAATDRSVYFHGLLPSTRVIRIVCIGGGGGGGGGAWGTADGWDDNGSGGGGGGGGGRSEATIYRASFPGLDTLKCVVGRGGRHGYTYYSGQLDGNPKPADDGNAGGNGTNGGWTFVALDQTNTYYNSTGAYASGGTLLCQAAGGEPGIGGTLDADPAAGGAGGSGGYAVGGAGGAGGARGQDSAAGAGGGGGANVPELNKNVVYGGAGGTGGAWHVHSWGSGSNWGDVPGGTEAGGVYGGGGGGGGCSETNKFALTATAALYDRQGSGAYGGYGAGGGGGGAAKFESEDPGNRRPPGLGGRGGPGVVAIFEW